MDNFNDVIIQNHTHSIQNSIKDSKDTTELLSKGDNGGDFQPPGDVTNEPVITNNAPLSARKVTDFESTKKHTIKHELGEILTSNTNADSEVEILTSNTVADSEVDVKEGIATDIIGFSLVDGTAEQNISQSNLEEITEIVTKEIIKTEVCTTKKECYNVQHVNTLLRNTQTEEHHITKIILTTPENEEMDLTETVVNDQKISYRKKVLKYDPDRKSSDGEDDKNPHVTTPKKSKKKKHSKQNYSYDNPNFVDFKTSTCEYFQFLSRYRVADTLPIFSRSKLQLQLRKHGIYHVNISLFGQTGSGKSALLNSMYYAINGSYIEYSAESKLKEQLKESVTNERIELRLTEAINILDNRGIDFSRQCLNEIEKQCEGYRESGELVPNHWKIGIKQKLKDLLSSYNTKLLLRNKIQCAVVVTSMKQKCEQLKIKELVRRIRLTTCRNPVVVITNVENIPKSEIEKRIIQFQEINCARIYHIENYTYQNHETRKPETDEQIVEALFNCCIVADQSTNEILKRLEASESCCSC